MKNIRTRHKFFIIVVITIVIFSLSISNLEGKSDVEAYNYVLDEFKFANGIDKDMNIGPDKIEISGPLEIPLFLAGQEEKDAKNITFSVSLKNISESEIYLGFSPVEDIATRKNYLQIRSDENHIQITQYGEDMIQIIDLANDDLEMEISYDIEGDTIENMIIIDGRPYITEGTFSKEFPNGFGIKDFWISIPQLVSGEVIIQSIRIG